MPSFELPEWADFEDSPLKQVAEHYNQIKTKWAERDRLDLSEFRRRFGSLDLGWQKFMATNKGQLWLDSSLMLNKLNYTGSTEETGGDANGSPGSGNHNTMFRPYSPLFRPTVLSFWLKSRFSKIGR